MRDKGHLPYKDHQPLVLLDLPPEILQKQKQFKPITTALQDANIKHKWSPTSDVQHQDTTHWASDLDSGCSPYLGFNPHSQRAQEDGRKKIGPNNDSSLT